MSKKVFYELDTVKNDPKPVKSISKLTHAQYERVMSKENRENLEALSSTIRDLEYWTEFVSPSGNLKLIIIEENNFEYLPKDIRDQVTMHLG